MLLILLNNLLIDQIHKLKHNVMEYLTMNQVNLF